jgi:endonuclease/exonuclease/phosphatase family metal-dependent hydrolase
MHGLWDNGVLSCVVERTSRAFYVEAAHLDLLDKRSIDHVAVLVGRDQDGEPTRHSLFSSAICPTNTVGNGHQAEAARN